MARSSRSTRGTQLPAADVVVDATELRDAAGHGLDCAGTDAAAGGDLDGVRGLGDEPLVHDAACDGGGEGEGDVAAGDPVGQRGRVGRGPLIEGQ